MRVVLDTNVLLSALISPHGPADAIYRAWRSVTGDHRAGLLQRGHVGRTRIVTPAVFCAEAL